jgi:type II secretory pathway pseudopilin PulG
VLVTPSRIRDEDGFTLVELLAAMVVGMIVLFAVFGLLDGAVRIHAKTTDQIETTGRGRLAIDLVSQSLGSRICLGEVPSLVAASATSVEYYASLAPETAGVRLEAQRRRLTFSGGAIREEMWTSSPPVSPPDVPPAVDTTPTRNRQLVNGIRQIGTTPVFRYYAYAGNPQRPTQLLTTPLSTGDLRRAVMIDVSFAARGARGDVATQYSNQILVRSATCV